MDINEVNVWNFNSVLRLKLTNRCDWLITDASYYRSFPATHAQCGTIDDDTRRDDDRVLMKLYARLAAEELTTGVTRLQNLAWHITIAKCPEILPILFSIICRKLMLLSYWSISLYTLEIPCRFFRRLWQFLFVHSAENATFVRKSAKCWRVLAKSRLIPKTCTPYPFSEQTRHLKWRGLGRRWLGGPPLLLLRPLYPQHICDWGSRSVIGTWCYCHHSEIANTRYLLTN